MGLRLVIFNIYVPCLVLTLAINVSIFCIKPSIKHKYKCMVPFGIIFLVKTEKKENCYFIHASTTPKLDKWYWIQKIIVSAIWEIIKFLRIKGAFPLPQNSEVWMTWMWNVKVWKIVRLFKDLNYLLVEQWDSIKLIMRQKWDSREIILPM